MTKDYDFIIIGSGAGGGTLARRFAPSNKSILLLERGGWLPREKENWDAGAVFVKNRYVPKETWYDKKGKPFQPGLHYWVGGATKLYGAALYRLRKEDFGEIKHYDGISPAWPISYEDMEPYYSLAEEMYQVHGAHGEDPIPSHRSHTSRASSGSAMISREPVIIPSMLHAGLCSMSRTCRSAPAFAVRTVTVFHVSCMPNRMPRWQAYARHCNIRMSLC